jgi:hypothetical protein
MNEPSNLTYLTIREVADALALRDVKLSYSSLSELLNTDDIAEQLGVQGGGNARKILPGVVDILADFWPQFKANKGRLPQAARMLKAYLQLRQDSSSEALVPVPPPGSLVPVQQFAHTPEPQPNPMEIAAVQGRAQGLAMTEKVLTASEAAEHLKISVRLLRKSIPAYRRFGKQASGDRWLLSQLVAVP